MTPPPQEGGPFRTRRRGRVGAAWVGALCLLGLFLGLPAAGAGQAASPLLPPDHWSHSALERLHDAGLLPEGFDPGTTTVGRGEALLAFRHALELAEASAPGWVALAEGYLKRFSDEFPASVERTDGVDHGFGHEAAVLMGFAMRRNALLARHRASLELTPGTEPLPDRTRPLGDLALGVFGPAGRISFAGHAVFRAEGGHLSASQLYGTLGSGPFGIWFGRRAFGFGASDAGSVVLQSAVSFDGAGAFLTDGIRLPGPLGFMGTLRAESHLSRIERSGGVESPWVFTLRAALQPHARIGVALNRGAFFGGTGELVPRSNFRRILKVITGIDTADGGRENFEDHVASVDIWFLPPVGALPLMLYGEWGVEDLQAQRREMPAFVTGARLGSVPGLPWLGLGVERTSFGMAPGDRGHWYEHRVFGTWTDGGRLLAHPLGGAGRELRLYALADFMESGVHAGGRIYTRRRDRGNLFAPDREGESVGGAVTVQWRLRPRLELEAGGKVEQGDGWSAGSGQLGLRAHF